MRSFLPVDRASLGQSLDRVVAVYESRCRSENFKFEQFWQEFGSPESVSLLATLAKIDIQRRFDLGERPRAAEYFEQFPILTESSHRVVSLVYEEFCLRQECAEGPDSEEFCQLYAPWQDSLRSQLAYHRQLSRAAGAEQPPVKFPLPGEQFDRYHLKSVLGRGGVARVYLATEDDLGGRKVAIKVSASFGQEPSILAKLDHRNIVPILTVARSESGLRGICMPYRPGLTLEDLIRRIGRGTPPRSARAIWESLRPSDTSEILPAEELRTGWSKFPIAGTFSEAVAWIGLALANALSYLHGEGVFHRDIKPANILLAYRDGPQLLDFNLAQDPGAPEQLNSVLKGGTLPYMAPEQLQSFLDGSGWEKVGSTADIYSLGLVLKELVTGQAPEVPPSSSTLPRGISFLLEIREGSPTLIREINPSVPPTLESIIKKCLAVSSEDRYETASDLAKDLQRFLNRQPLIHAPNQSKVERTINCLVRNRQAFLLGVALLIFTALLAGFQSQSHLPISERIEQNVYLIDSSRPDDWQLAKARLEVLQKEYPTSAWPPLCLSLVLQKIGGEVNNRTAFTLIQHACNLEDAEEALTGRLRKDPNSADLLTNLGIKLFKKGKLEQSREVLLRAIQADAGGFASWATLAEVEKATQEFDQAIEHYSKAIKICEARTNKKGDQIYRIRGGMLAVYVKMINRALDASPPQGDRASNYLRRLEETFDQFQRDWQSMEKFEETLEIHNWTIQWVKGSVASTQGVLLAETNQRELATESFGKAASYFNTAHQILATKLRSKKDLRVQTDEQEDQLRARRWSYRPSTDLPNPVVNEPR